MADDKTECKCSECEETIERCETCSAWFIDLGDGEHIVCKDGLHFCQDCSTNARIVEVDEQ